MTGDLNILHHANEAGAHPGTAPAMRSRLSMQFSGRGPVGDTEHTAARHLAAMHRDPLKKPVAPPHGIIPPHKVLPPFKFGGTSNFK